MSETEKKRVGRPKGKKNAGKSRKFQPETIVRAHQIFRANLGHITSSRIAQQLLEEGYEPVDSRTLTRWRRESNWEDKPLKVPLGVEESAELGQAIRVRVPDDLQRVEAASNALAEVTEALAKHVMGQIPQIEITTPEGLRTVTECMSDLLRCHLAVGKGLQDLRLLRVSNFSAPKDEAKNGEIIPPDSAAAELSDQARVISKFTMPGG